MSDNFVGQSNAENERGGDSSSRKRKKNSKPIKQPQRGVGVAQLERIRIRSEMAMAYHPPFSIPYFSPSYINEGFRVPTGGYSSMSSSSFGCSTPASAASNGIHPSIMMGFAGYGRRNKFSNLQSDHNTWLIAGTSNLDDQSFIHPSMNTMQILNLHQEDFQQKKKHRSDSLGSSSQNDGSSESEKIDLELRL